jgi:hypothetical protein
MIGGIVLGDRRSASSGANIGTGGPISPTILGYGPSGEGYGILGDVHATSGEGYAAWGEGYVTSGEGHAAVEGRYAMRRDGHAASGKGHTTAGERHATLENAAKTSRPFKTNGRLRDSSEEKGTGLVTCGHASPARTSRQEPARPAMPVPEPQPPQTLPRAR